MHWLPGLAKGKWVAPFSRSTTRCHDQHLTAVFQGSAKFVFLPNAFLPRVHTLKPNTRVHSLKPNTTVHPLKPNTRVDPLKPNTTVHPLKPNTRVDPLKPNTRVHHLKPNTRVHSLKPNIRLHTQRQKQRNVYAYTHIRKQTQWICKIYVTKNSRTRHFCTPPRLDASRTTPMTAGDTQYW